MPMGMGDSCHNSHAVQAKKSGEQTGLVSACKQYGWIMETVGITVNVCACVEIINIYEFRVCVCVYACLPLSGCIRQPGIPGQGTYGLYDPRL